MLHAPRMQHLIDEFTPAPASATDPNTSVVSAMGGKRTLALRIGYITSGQIDPIVATHPPSQEGHSILREIRAFRLA